MAPVKKKTTRKKKSTGNQSSRQIQSSYQTQMVEAIASANMRLASTGKADGSIDGGSVGDSIERRYTNYDSILGNSDVLYSEYNSTRGVGNECGSYTAFIKRLASSDRIHHNIIAQCILAYIHYGIIKIIVDLYADFATTGFQIIHDNSATQNFYRIWAKKVNLTDRINRIFCDFFLTANVFIYRMNAKLKTSEEKEMKRGKAEDVQNLGKNSIIINRGKTGIVISPSIVVDNAILGLAGLAQEAKVQATKGTITKVIGEQKVVADKNDRVIPWEYLSLPPTQMESRKIGLQSTGEWIFALNTADTSLLSNFLHYIYDPKLKQTKVELPPFLQDKLRTYSGQNNKEDKDDENAYASEIVMDADKLTVIQDKKFDYWAWAIPFVYSALGHLRFKDCLRGMETRVCKSVINTITLWKLGDAEKGMMPGPDEFERLADMLQSPGQAMNIIWGPYIDATVVEPKLSNILDPKKHDAVNRDILIALGIPEVLLGGKGANFSNSFVSIAATLQKLQMSRDKIEQWLLGELKIIADAMGFRTLPRIKWDRNDLRDKDAEKKFKLALFDRGVLSGEALLIEADEDFNTEVARQEKEKKVADGSGVGIMDKRGPYYRPEELAKIGIFPYGWEADRNMEAIKREDMDLDIEKQKKMSAITEQSKEKSSTEKAPNGRPPGEKDKTKRETRKPKPKGIETASQSIKIDELQQKGNVLLKEIMEAIRKKKGQARGSKLDQLVLNTASNIGVKYDKFIIDKGLQKKGDMNSAIATIFDFLQDQWKLSNVTNKLTKADKYKLFLYAWASYYIDK